MSEAPALDTPEANSSKNASARQSPVSETSRREPAKTLDQMGSVKARMRVSNRVYAWIVPG
jgi:hypothetical protein